ncbi:MAG: homogentisate 1,2-dioxygenase [Actinomycetota bacterium]
MPHYRRVGDVPGKRHILHKLDDGLAFEEMIGVGGFSGASALLYHRRSPSAVVRIEAVEHPQPSWQPNYPLRPHHLRTDSLAPADDAVLGRHALLGNDDIEIAYVTATQTGPLYRNAIGDELVYVHAGAAVLESVFGRLPIATGDYAVVPASTTHRWVVEHRAELLVITATGHVGIPDRYLNDQGQMRDGAPFSERDLRGPDPEPLLVDGEDVPVLVRTRAGFSRHVHATHPFDVVGWDGALYPWALNINDFEPIVGRLHQPPPVHQTFAGPNFVVCSFVPRLFDFDPDAVKVPYHHSNVDSDEVLFYAAGDFMSRAGSGIGVGSISVHPAGFVHGPQPGSVERAMGVDRTEETAVMVDTLRPLQLSETALAISDPAYPGSWNQ